VADSQSRVLRIELPELEPGDTHAVEQAGYSILICNVDGELYAVENRCSHAEVELTQAVLEGCELECPSHGALFDVRDGRALALPARTDIKSYPIERVGTGAEVEVRV
jgi:nitrite reductase/ring-hydroxylating ferredoxin subunit